MFEKIKNFVITKRHQIAVGVAAPAISAAGYVAAFADDPTPTVTSYLSGVAEVFQWILTQITTLINFIFANPFLAVSLYLFMAGCVIAFFIRIKNA